MRGQPREEPGPPDLGGAVQVEPVHPPTLDLRRRSGVGPRDQTKVWSASQAA
ncbi:hypothetical protein [Ornithinimicrobium kibberense]|uniref:hypothetical protein n=1 Tax=Ornithinimicrobium kibberense TaxID=282060 RepID=UPI003618DFE0